MKYRQMHEIMEAARCTVCGGQLSFVEEPDWESKVDGIHQIPAAKARCCKKVYTVMVKRDE